MAILIIGFFLVFTTWLFLSEALDIEGELSSRDLADIRAVIADSPKVVEKRIILIEVIEANRVNVHLKGAPPKEDWGEALGMEKRNGEWEIVTVGRWNS